jgi:hypothetical protein
MDMRERLSGLSLMSRPFLLAGQPEAPRCHHTTVS